MGSRRSATLLATLLLSGCAASGAGFSGANSGALPAQRTAESGTARYATANDIPPRLQWLANYGYCGETAFISAGLYYGQYLSQYTARAIASNGTPQNLAKSQLLIGSNDLYAAKRMHLVASEWRPPARPDAPAFLTWVKSRVANGEPVIVGVYTNEYRFYGKKNPNAGDPQYDHIVPVLAVSSSRPPSDAAYDARDRLTFSDNGLWGTARNTPYLFSYTFGSFQRTRAQANAKNAPVYSLSDATRNYGVAISGVVDRDHETLPVRIATSVNYEKPVMANGSSRRPRPMPLVLTVTVSNLHPGVRYVLYRYDRFSAVPGAGFNAHAANASARWRIRIASGSTYTIVQRIESDRTAIYRAVAASSP